MFFLNFFSLILRLSNYIYFNIIDLILIDFTNVQGQVWLHYENVLETVDLVLILGKKVNSIEIKKSL